MILDFEIDASLRAERLTVHAPPDARVAPVGPGVTVWSRERRDGLPARICSGETYARVAVKKRVFATGPGRR